MLRSIARSVDRLVSRGEGLGPDHDPFAPPMDALEAAQRLAIVRDARFTEGFRTPLAVHDGGPYADVGLTPPRRGSAWVVLAPPYGTFARPGKLGVYRAHALALARRGFGLATLGLPFHGARTLQGRPSGWGFVRADLAHTARAVTTAAAEAAALARWLREERGATRVVGLGMSLGGAAVGLAAAMGAPFDKLAFLAAVDSCASFYETGQNREARRRTLRAAGFGPQEVVDAFRAVAPSTYPAPKAPALFAIAPEDGVVPAAAQRAWRDAWSGATLELGWRGHAIALTDPMVARKIAQWLVS